MPDYHIYQPENGGSGLRKLTDDPVTADDAHAAVCQFVEAKRPPQDLQLCAIDTDGVTYHQVEVCPTYIVKEV